MRFRHPRHIALGLLALFLFFFTGSIAFTHSHIAGGVRIVHSHPSLPGSHHSHTQDGFVTLHIALASLHAMQVASVMQTVERPQSLAVLLLAVPALPFMSAVVTMPGGRDPPLTA